MDRRDFIAGLVLLAAPLAAEAQPTGKVFRIGFILTTAPDEVGHFFKALDEGLRKLGYVEGRNVVFERRFAEGRQERLPALATELVQLKVDVLVTGSNPVIAAVKQVTATIPVVMAVSRDPVGAFLWNPVPPGAGTTKNAVESAARRLGLTFQSVEVRGPNEFESAFAAMVRERANGVVVATDPVVVGPRSQVVLLAARSRLPVVYGLREFAEVGGLMSYGPNIATQFRRAAIYVDKILKGAKPADLPIEQPTTFELVINLKTAKALGLTIPQSLLQRADQVIQ